MTGNPTPAPQRVIGRYALYGGIASGGMATVHYGRLLGPVGFSRTVAIKRLHPQFAKDPEFVSMFLDEARVAARIQHPNVVSTIDVVALEGELFLVMEYVQGESLARLMGTHRRRAEPIPLDIVGSVMTNLLDGLHAAHEATDEHGTPLSIVHRDISPQNVLVGTDGVARVLDFGVAKAAGRLQTTREGQVKGKIAYMPPEQLGGEKMDRRTDVYAAAVVLWEMLTASRLFDGENETVVLAKVITGAVPPPSTLNPAVTPELEAVVLRALARDPAERFASAHEMAVALEEVMPTCPARRVGRWVEEIAGTSLEERAAVVKEIEKVTSDANFRPSQHAFLAEATTLDGKQTISSSQPPTRVEAPNADGTLSKVSTVSVSSPPGRRRPSRRVPFWLAAVAALIGGIGAFVVFGGAREKPAQAGGDLGAEREVADVEPTADKGDAAPNGTSDDAAAIPEDVAEKGGDGDGTKADGSTETDDAAEDVPPPAPTSVAKPPPVATVQPKPTSKPATNTNPVPPPAETAAPPPGASCNPPYTVDANGIRRIKPECI